MEGKHFLVILFAFASSLNCVASNEDFSHISTCIFEPNIVYDELNSDIGQQKGSGFHGATFICRGSNMEQVIFHRDSLNCRLGKRGYSVSFKYGTIIKINFENCKFHDIDSRYFTNYTMLRSLDVSNTGLEKISVADLNLLHLTSFIASHNRLTVFPHKLLDRMHYVKSLDISNNSISRIAASDFEGAKNLVVLNMSHNHLEEIPSDLFKDAAQLAVVDFSSNAINQVRTTAFIGAKSLNSLNLSNNRLKALESHLFDSMLKLKYLNLANNPIGNLKFNTFTYLTNLEHLVLRQTNISNILFGTFSFQSKLISLDLSENFLKWLDFDLFLPVLQHLKTLRLANNQLQYLDGFNEKLFPHLNSLDIKNNNFKCQYLIRFMKSIDWNNIDIPVDPNAVDTQKPTIRGINCENHGNGGDGIPADGNGGTGAIPA